MRTTLTIDDDLLAAAKALARTQAVSVGEVISDLARRGLQAAVKTDTRNALPVFHVPLGARPLTPDDVRKIEDEA